MAAALETLFMTPEHVANCFKCGVPILALRGTGDRLREKKTEFFCINGHAQWFAGPSPLEREKAALERQLQFEKNRRESAERNAEQHSNARVHAERSAASYRGKLTTIKTRVKNGVCPCCKRSFTALARHIATKHPGYAPDSES